MASVLLVDDDRSIRDVVATMLASGGHTVEVADDGKAGLHRFRESRPDVVVTDIIMPEGEGLETIRAMRALDPSVPIIAISGGGRTNGADFLDIARKFGAVASLSKPFRASELLGAVSAALQR